MGAYGEGQAYGAWLDGLDSYLDLYGKGLKKQANAYIGGFLEEFAHSVPKSGMDEILCRFCREICDEGKHSRLLERGNGSLPHALGGVVWEYLKGQCEMEAMPQMRWAFQLFGKYYNPFDPRMELDLPNVLEKAYRHRDCDQKTAELYFREILERLYWGAHHFPDACIISKAAYGEISKAAETVLAEKQVPRELAERYIYYKKLYQCFYEFEGSGREKDFYGLCREAGIPFGSMPTYFFR